MARIPRIGLHDPCETYLLPFNDEYYNVPVENVLLYAKFTNCMPASHISTVLNSESPLNWRNYLTSGRVLHIRGMEGSAVYTTFVASDEETRDGMNAPEQRVLHQMPHAVADADFALLKEWARCAYPEPRNPRQNARINVYDWRKGIDMPDHDRIDPVANGWPLADISAPSTAQMGSPAPVLPDPMADWDAHISDIETARQPQPTPQSHAPPPAAEYAALLEGIDWNGDAPWYPPAPPPPPLPPPLPRVVVVRQSRRLAQDLRALSDFLFECKDLVQEGTYLAASDALQRVWDQHAL